MAAVQQFLSLTDDYICVLNEHGFIEEVNGNWKRAMELPAGADISLINLIEEENGDQRLKQFLTDKRLSVMRIPSCRIKDFSGNRFWVDFKIRRIPSQNKYWCLIRDISRKKRSDLVLDQIGEACQLGFWEYQSSNNTLNWSRKIFDIFNTNAVSTIPTMNVFRQYFLPEDFEQIDQLKTRNFEFTFKIMIDNKEKWIYLKGSKEVFSNGDYHLQGILQDVTLDTRKEFAQLASNIELSSFEKGLDQFSIVARTDARGRIIAANEEFCRISKYTEEELLGEDHRLLNSGYHPKAFFQEMWNCIKQGKNWRGEIKNKAKDGSYYWVDTIIIPIKDSEGNLLEILSFRFEITNLKHMQEQNQILKNQLDLLMTAQTHAYYSYDFREEKTTLSPLMKELIGQANPTSFNQFVALFTERDQDALLASLKDQKILEFKDNVLMNAKEICLHIKFLRNHVGEVIHLDALCYQVSKRQTITSPVNFLAKDFS